MIFDKNGYLLPTYSEYKIYTGKMGIEDAKRFISNELGQMALFGRWGRSGFTLTVAWELTEYARSQLKKGKIRQRSSKKKYPKFDRVEYKPFRSNPKQFELFLETE